MSVRVTERLIGDVVIASGLPKSPLMVVQEIDEETKMVSTTWFSDGDVCQEGYFPGSALDRYEVPKAKAPKDKKAAAPKEKKAAAPRGRKPASK